MFEKFKMFEFLKAGISSGIGVNVKKKEKKKKEKQKKGVMTWRQSLCWP